ncbi:MAG: NAD-dependent epimerase/dehydratase family protein [Leadbetterella sp.]
MNILLTGFSGLIGNHIAELVLESGHSLKALVRQSHDLIVPEKIKAQVTLVEGDILDILSLEKAIEDVDWVIHSAAKVSFARKDIDSMMKTNIEGTANVVNVSLSAGIKKLCYISSVAALGKPNQSSDEKNKVYTINESAKWLDDTDISAYSKSKYLAENEVWRAHMEGLPVVIVNPSIVLGEGDWQRSSSQIFKYIFDQKPYYTDGSINVVDVKDVARACLDLLYSDVSGERFILNAQSIIYKDFFDSIAARFKVNAPSFKVKPWMIEIVWRWESVKSLITGSAPLITKETAGITKRTINFDSRLIQDRLNFNFTSLDSTLDRICAFYIEYAKKK